MQDRFKFRYFDNTSGMEEISLTNCYYTNLDYSKLMQCTGLKDKNGKLIYEGDIVKFGEFYDNEWNSFNIGKVYWGGKFDYPAFELQCSTVDFDMSNGLSYIFGNGLNIEVIGNIYQDKELLNEI